ncbi:MAG TPA: NPCBM/NEW2 domain-containing protein, partial [Fimbriimonas sp.]
MLPAAISLAFQVCHLADLDLTPATQGWGKPMRNRSVTDTPLRIAGQTFADGVGTHARSVIRIGLDGKATRFRALCGVDDNAKSDRASVMFRVVADGKTRWRSPLMRWNTRAIEADVPLKGVRSLLLIVEDGGDGIDHDHANWADASIEYRGKAPKTKKGPSDRPVILTPRPPKSPRMNGPMRTGVRPGSPLVFRIPTTGDRPMRFRAEGLPEGVSLDPDSGILSGALDRRGTYPIRIVATNRRGSASRTLEVVCGDEIALTPHMGWNSWYVWEHRVSDAVMRAAADAMVSTGLADHGWQYVNIDDAWSRRPSDGATRDDTGRILPNEKFPDMRALTDHIHTKGLRAGIYTSPGPLTCGGYEGSFGHERIDAETFADWGFDFLKHDWCSYQPASWSLEELQKPYRLMGGLLKEQKRDIVYNLCQYGMGKVWQWGKEVGGHSWRTAGDLGIGFPLFREGLDLYADEELHRYAGPGAYNDPDYLLLGELSNFAGGLRKTPFTPNEQYVQVTFWCLVSAPLILSGDVTKLDAFTLSLLTNDEVIAVDQDPWVKAAKRVARDEDLEVWAKPLSDGSLAVGLL